VDQFIQVHKNSISSIKITLKETLEDQIKSTIETELSSVGKGWFNLHEEKESYYFSKLKRLLSIIKYMTQETLFKLCSSSVKKFFLMIKQRMPDDTIITNSIKVKNVFNSLNAAILGLSDDDQIDYPEPLISLELQGSSDLQGSDDKAK